jgi:endoglucanase
LEGFAQPGGETFSDWQGFMALAAAQLFRAGAGNAQGNPYLSDAIGYLNAADVEGGFSPYFSVGGLAAADLCGGLDSEPVACSDVRSAACAKLSQAAAAAIFRARLNAFESPGGFYFGWASYHGGSGALLAAASRASAIVNRVRAYDIALGARDFLLGRNPWGVSFLVGPGGREAKNPHHAVFLKGKPSKLGDGFVVGGPAIASQFGDFGLKPDADSALAKFNPTYHDAYYDGKVVYEDRRADFITSEVGIAYSASAMLLVASVAAGP